MESNSEKKIKVLPNGPYEVIGDIPLNQLRYIGDRKGASTGYKEIQKYSVEGVYHLCRCGGSYNKPFCDGTHKKIGFKGDTTASHDSYDEMSVLYEGKVIDMLDAESLCAVARFCDTHGTAWLPVSVTLSPSLKKATPAFGFSIKFFVFSELVPVENQIVSIPSVLIFEMTMGRG